MPEFEFDKGLVLSSKPLGDKKFIVSLFTKEKGRHLGVVKKKMPPLTASFFSGRWQARLSEQMGSFYLEDEKSVHLSFLDDKKRLNVISSMCYLLDHLLPERESYPEFYDLTYHFLTSLEEDDFQKKYIFWEVELLGALGFGLDLSKCAGGGDANDLAYVSPKTGRAVSKKMGDPYKDKLLPLPAFMFKNEAPNKDDLLKGLSMTGYFLITHVGLKNLPVLRHQIIL